MVCTLLKLVEGERPKMTWFAQAGLCVVLKGISRGCTSIPTLISFETGARSNDKAVTRHLVTEIASDAVVFWVISSLRVTVINEL